MSVGNDGFTDCNYVCNPENDMSWSCNEYCPDYKFTTTTPTALPTTESVHPDTSEDEDALLSSYWIVCLCSGVLLLTILGIVCCCCKQRILGLIQNCRSKSLHHPTQVENATTDEEAESGTQDFVQEGTALLPAGAQNNIKNNATRVSPGTSIDSGVSVANASVHFADEVGNNRNTTVNGGQNDMFEDVRSRFPDANNRYDDDISQAATEGTDHSDVETIPKEVGELACLAIGQNSACVKNTTTFNPTTDVITATNTAEHFHEGDEHVVDNVFDKSDDNTDDTDASVDVSNPENDENDIPVVHDRDDSDGCYGDDEDNDDEEESGSDDDDDDDDDYEDDDDVNYNEAENVTSSVSDEDIARNGSLLNHYTNKKENTASNKNGIVRVVTEINLREL